MIFVKTVIQALEFFFLRVYKIVPIKIRNLSFNLGLEEVLARKVTIISLVGHTDIIHHTTTRSVRYTGKYYL